VAELIVPELTEAQVRKNDKEIKAVTGRLVRMSVKFSVIVGVFLFLFSDMLGQGIYKSAEAGHYIRLLAPLVPIMYTDMSLDGCLKGLGQQVWSMGINIVDALSGLVLVWWLLPKYALTAYIGIIYFTELLNFVLSYGRLRKILSSPLLRFWPDGE